MFPVQVTGLLFFYSRILRVKGKREAGAGLGFVNPLEQFLGGNQVEEIETEIAEDFVGSPGGKGPFSLEDVMNVGLGNAGNARQTSFGHFAAVDAFAEALDESVFKFLEVHGGGWTYCNRK